MSGASNREYKLSAARKFNPFLLKNNREDKPKLNNPGIRQTQ
jgi:hypothetical protein